MKYVRIDPEKPFEYHAHTLAVICGERCTGLHRKECFVVELSLHPRHQVLKIVWRRHFRWSLHPVTIAPGKRVQASTHPGTSFMGATVLERHCQEIQVIEKIYYRDRNPLILVSSLRKFNLLPEIRTTQGLLPFQQQRAIPRVCWQLLRGQERGVPLLLATAVFGVRKVLHSLYQRAPGWLASATAAKRKDDSGVMLNLVPLPRSKGGALES
mmetsp:Transcript_97623/g.188255  ORF Transcript_97623/g.188255 Transcript_97623/m.188255 type:complete len:212 (+) Transcript_97623:412-1047(+)